MSRQIIDTLSPFMDRKARTISIALDFLMKTPKMYLIEHFLRVLYFQWH